MRKQIRLCLAAAMLCLASTIGAQQVNTLYFLENAPMRHLINPAFQPVSNGYLSLPFLGYTSFWLGNNSLSMADVIYPKNGQIITALHPDEDRSLLMRRLRNQTNFTADVTTSLLAFGFRYRDAGYITIGADLRMDGGLSVPKGLFDFMLNGGMRNLDGVNTIKLSGLNLGLQLYTEVYGGYSHQINDQWTVGGKLKVLLGVANVSLVSRNVRIDASRDIWRLHGDANLYAAAPINIDRIADQVNQGDISQMNFDGVIGNNYLDFLKPAGGGVAVDLGMTYKPHKMVQITAAIDDLGFIYWKRGAKVNAAIDTTYTGVGDFEFADYISEEGTFMADSLMSDAMSNLTGLLGNGGLHAKGGYARMASARLNIGVDANFWNNRVGVGLVSSTRMYNNHLYEELTLGAAFRPLNWFNLALSYSMLNNGRGSSFGAGLSLMPYDGINLTLAADYVPTNFAYITNSKGQKSNIPIPYHMKGVNLAFGLSIVWGTNKKKDSDKDGVLDRWDMCPGTPKGVRVDTLGCPLDSDGDGVPDYLDDCIETPVAAYGWVDEHGCPTDEDNDSVPDYLDNCPGTPIEARAYVDEHGCDKDTDGDGVPDYIDQCPDTPEGARGYVDSVGCELDTDLDGVPDWRDRCPETPEEARTTVDEFGCERDSDGDGVPDWRDECPNTPAEARGFVDEKGCELDTDGDGVLDYMDECPTVVGVRENKGCPALKREYTNTLKKAMSGIQFETGKAIIKKSSNTILNQVAAIFLEDTSFRIEIQGHTDNVGKPEANKTLSQKRAEAVREYMIKKGVAAERMTAVGYGDERPIADNATSKGRATNRRVEFDLIYEEKVVEEVMDHAEPVAEPVPAGEANQNE